MLVEHDEFKKVTSFTGPNVAQEQDDELLLRAWKLRSGTMAYQIYVADEYTYAMLRGGQRWRFYSSAHDSDGNALPTTMITRTVNWCGRNVCSFIEVLGVEVTKDYLKERKERGLLIKLSGKN